MLPAAAGRAVEECAAQARGLARDSVRDIGAGRHDVPDRAAQGLVHPIRQPGRESAAVPSTPIRVLHIPTAAQIPGPAQPSSRSGCAMRRSPTPAARPGRSTPPSRRSCRLTSAGLAASRSPTLARQARRTRRGTTSWPSRCRRPSMSSSASSTARSAVSYPPKQPNGESLRPDLRPLLRRLRDGLPCLPPQRSTSCRSRSVTPPVRVLSSPPATSPPASCRRAAQPSHHSRTDS